MTREPGESTSIAELVAGAAEDAQPFADTVRHLGADNPAVIAALELGVGLGSGVAGTQAAVDELREYHRHVDLREASGWMDNTTVLTASTLMSDGGYEAMTPLTVWDLVTFARAVVGYERLYHHAHPSVDDASMNRSLGEDVFRAVPLPVQSTGATSVLPERWEGAHRFMCDLWFNAHQWLKRLANSVNSGTLDGVELAAVRDAWSLALGRPDLQIESIVNWKDATTRWQSPSDTLLTQIADATQVAATYMYLDPTPPFQELARQRAAAGLKTIDNLGQLLTDLNLRAYINQRLADFFGVPYVCGAARVPFRKHLYDRAVGVQYQLAAVDVIDDRYAEVARDVKLRLPVFLALAVREASGPADLWHALAELRREAKPYRVARKELDDALMRRDAKQAAFVAKALATDVDSVLLIAGKAVASAGVAVIEEVAKGDVMGVASSVAAVEAASRGLLASSVVDRLIWRLRRPYLLWMNDVIDEAKHLTEALPAVARIWQLPEREQSLFTSRFVEMGKLQAIR